MSMNGHIIQTAEQEAQAFMAAAADKIADMLAKSIASSQVILGFGRAPTQEAGVAAAEKITEIFGGAILAAMQGERDVKRLTAELEEATRQADALAATVIPPDHVVVPREPTAAMLQGACEGHRLGEPMSDGRPCPKFEARKHIWADMIANADH